MKYVVADIHGEISKLKLLLENISAIDKSPTFIFIGDYVDKGEDSYATLQFLNTLAQKYECVFLRGNHEYYWESLKTEEDEYSTQLLKYGGKNTIKAFNEKQSLLGTKEQLLKEFSIFFNSLVNYYQTDKYTITHSGIPPEMYNTAIENISTEKFLLNRYAFLNQSVKYFGTIVIFGHTAFSSPYYDGYKIGIDTAACYIKEQPLTAFCIDEDFFINSSNEIVQLLSINQDVCPAIIRVKAWQQQ